jgi:hypothetical protein
MKNQKLQSQVMNSQEVYTTTDYFLFKPIDGNRKKNLMHINRLKKSIEKNYLFTVIIVNEKNEIIDGQHRFDVISELQLPLHYIICNGYGLSEVHIFNQNGKTWNSDDYLTGYCDLGYLNYIKYRDFKLKYNLGHHQCMAILSRDKSTEGIKSFMSGDLKIKGYKASEDFMDKILLVEKYYDGIRRRSFIFAMLSLFNNENFNFEEFLIKLKNQPTALQDCINVTEYKSVIEEIYNYRRKEKVNLRF